MVKECVIFVIMVIVAGTQVTARSLDLVREVDIELPANEKISKRDTSAMEADWHFTKLPEEAETNNLQSSEDRVLIKTKSEEKIVKERGKRFLLDTGFHVEEVMGRI